jgi:transposase
MDATCHALPDDVQTLRAMLAQQQLEVHRRDAQLAEQQATIEELQRQKQGLEHRLDLALRKIYGRLSERIDPGQLLLFGQAMAAEAQAMQKLAQAQQAEGLRESKPKRGHGRRALPADLPRHRVEHELSAQELTCPCCDQPRVRIGEEISEQLDYTPASLFVIQHVRPKYACRRCEQGGVVTAARPAEGQVIERGLPGPGLVAHVITSKYADHQPLYRQEAMLARHAPGLDLTRSTMCGWMKAAADLLTPLVRLMATRVRQSKVIHTDDTPVPVQAPGKGRTKTGRLWVYLGDDTSGGGGPYTVFDYTPTRQRDGPATWLADFQGYLQADAFGGYDGIYARSEGGKVTEVACWAHTRRKFYDARNSDPSRSHQALAMIRLLYDVERLAKDLDAHARLMLRRQHAKPVLQDFHRWMDAELPAVLPKSPMGQAFAYARNNWEALTRYATGPEDDAGYLSIDNNAAERAIRPLTIGRKNYLFVGSDAGGRTAAVLYSLVASAKRHGLDPFVYLRDVLATIGATPVSQLDQFLPDRWRQQELHEITQS